MHTAAVCIHWLRIELTCCVEQVASDDATPDGEPEAAELKPVSW